MFPGRAIFDDFVVVHVAAYDSFRCWRQSFTPQEDADRLSIPVPPHISRFSCSNSGTCRALIVITPAM